MDVNVGVFYYRGKEAELKLEIMYYCKIIAVQWLWAIKWEA